MDNISVFVCKSEEKHYYGTLKFIPDEEDGESE